MILMNLAVLASTELMGTKDPDDEDCMQQSKEQRYSAGPATSNTHSVLRQVGYDTITITAAQRLMKSGKHINNKQWNGPL